MKFTDYLQAIDDGDLTVYEFRYLAHIWRRGTCWEKQDNIAKACHMSRPQAYRARDSLLEKGWLIHTLVEGRIALKVADTIPGTEKQGVVSVSDRDEYNALFVSGRDGIVSDRDEYFSDRDALPNNRTKEVNPLNGNGAGGVIEKSEGQIVWDAVVDLVKFWEQLTRQKCPPIKTPAFDSSWYNPLKEIWVMCGRDVDLAKARIQATRQGLIGRNISIFDAAKLPKHVQEMIDRELISMTERLNGNAATPTDAHAAETIWQRIVGKLNNGQRIEDPREAQAVRAIGGASVIRQANEFTTPKLKGRLFDEYQRVATAS